MMLVWVRTLVLRKVTSGGLRIEYCVMEFSPRVSKQRYSVSFSTK